MAGSLAAQDSTSSAASDSKDQSLPPPSSAVGAGVSSGRMYAGAPVFKVCGPRVKQPCGTAPVAKDTPDPQYSGDARNKKVEGIVVLSVIVGPDGRTHDIRVDRSLGYGLDEEAAKAVAKWKFKPSTFNGHPVAIEINVRVRFRVQ
jgi:TonB family protein